MSEEKPTSLEDLEQMFDDVPNRLTFAEDLVEKAEEEGEVIPQPQLCYAEIAELAHNLVAAYSRMMWPTKPFPFFEELEDEQRNDIIVTVDEIMQRAQKIDIMDWAKAKHAQQAMSLLAAGYKFGIEENDELKESPLIMPWEYLPNEHKMPIFLFTECVRRLVVSVWSGI